MPTPKNTSPWAHRRDFVDKRSRVRVSATAYSRWCPTGSGELPELFLVEWIMADAKRHPRLKGTSRGLPIRWCPTDQGELQEARAIHVVVDNG
ncbi:hypothetical protein Tco_1023302 [Tanacetum coccineum]